MGYLFNHGGRLIHVICQAIRYCAVTVGSTHFQKLLYFSRESWFLYYVLIQLCARVVRKFLQMHDSKDCALLLKASFRHLCFQNDLFVLFRRTQPLIITHFKVSRLKIENLSDKRHTPAKRVAVFDNGYPSRNNAQRSPFPFSQQLRTCMRLNAHNAINHYLLLSSGRGANAGRRFVGEFIVSQLSSQAIRTGDTFPDSCCCLLSPERFSAGGTGVHAPQVIRAVRLSYGRRFMRCHADLTVAAGCLAMNVRIRCWEFRRLCQGLLIAIVSEEQLVKLSKSK